MATTDPDPPADAPADAPARRVPLAARVHPVAVAALVERTALGAPPESLAPVKRAAVAALGGVPRFLAAADPDAAFVAARHFAAAVRVLGDLADEVPLADRGRVAVPPFAAGPPGRCGAAALREFLEETVACPAAVSAPPGAGRLARYLEDTVRDPAAADAWRAQNLREIELNIERMYGALHSHWWPSGRTAAHEFVLALAHLASVGAAVAERAGDPADLFLPPGAPEAGLCPARQRRAAPQRSGAVPEAGLCPARQRRAPKEPVAPARRARCCWLVAALIAAVLLAAAAEAYLRWHEAECRAENAPL